MNEAPRDLLGRRYLTAEALEAERAEAAKIARKWRRRDFWRDRWEAARWPMTTLAIVVALVALSRCLD